MGDAHPPGAYPRGAGPPTARRAPRLGPREYIGGHVTRHGRFRRLDPLKPRRPPSLAQVLAVLGWALLVEESLRRARRAARASRASGD